VSRGTALEKIRQVTVEQRIAAMKLVHPLQQWNRFKENAWKKSEATGSSLFITSL
jgi:hypothetical protein